VVWKKQFGAFVAGAGYQFASDPSTTPSTAGRGGKNSTQSAALAWNAVFNAPASSITPNPGFSHKSWSLGATRAWFHDPCLAVLHYDAEQAAIAVAPIRRGRFRCVRAAGKLDYEADS